MRYVPRHLDSDGPSQNFDRARDPDDVLGAQVYPQSHDDLIGVVVCNLQAEAPGLRVGDVKSGGLKSVAELLHAVNLDKAYVQKQLSNVRFFKTLGQKLK